VTLLQTVSNCNATQKIDKIFNFLYRYLGQNQITVVEGLDHNKNLTELHIEYQNLPDGEKLLFDPRTIESLSVRYKYLHLRGWVGLFFINLIISI